MLGEAAQGHRPEELRILPTEAHALTRTPVRTRPPEPRRPTWAAALACGPGESVSPTPAPAPGSHAPPSGRAGGGAPAAGSCAERLRGQRARRGRQAEAPLGEGSPWRALLRAARPLGTRPPSPGHEEEPCFPGGHACQPAGVLGGRRQGGGCEEKRLCD